MFIHLPRYTVNRTLLLEFSGTSPTSTRHLSMIPWVLAVALIVTVEVSGVGRGTMIPKFANAVAKICSEICMPLISHSTIPTAEQVKLARVPRATDVD